MPPSDLRGVVARLRDAADAGLTVADEPTGKALLNAAGVATPEGRVVGSAAAAAKAAADLGGPVGLKIVTPELAHRSDVDGVFGPLESVEAVRQAAVDLLARLGGELLVEAWETGGTHCFVGLSLRGPLGPVVSVGIGGIWVEVLRDVAHRAAPVTADEAAEALLSLRGSALLRGGVGGDARRSISRRSPKRSRASAGSARAGCARAYRRDRCQPAAGSRVGCAGCARLHDRACRAVAQPSPEPALVAEGAS